MRPLTKLVCLIFTVGVLFVPLLRAVVPPVEFVPGEILVGLKEGETIDNVVARHKVKVSHFDRIHNPKAVVDRFKKSYKPKKDKSNKYLVGNKSFGNLAEITDENWLKEATNTMTTSNKRVYRGYKIKLVTGNSMADELAMLKSDPNIEYAEPNYIGHISYVPPNNSRYGDQWPHQKAHAEQGWDITRGSSAIIIAIIDTGVDYNHEDLAANIWRDASNNPGRDIVNSDNDPMDDQGHGTHCAGIAAAVDNDRGVVGACPQCKIMPIKAGDSSGSFTWSNVAAGITWAKDHGARIMSMSFTGYSGSSTLANAIYAARDDGVVMLAAAGNDNTSNTAYPASYDGVIAVGATYGEDGRSWFSNYGSWVDVAAPGEGIWSTVRGNGYESWNGTSMATPYVAGIAGLIRSMNPNISRSDVETKIKSGVNAISTDQPIGTGRVNVYKALVDYTDRNIYRSNSGKQISMYSRAGNWYELNNTSDKNYFIPNKTQFEFYSFMSTAGSISGLDLQQKN